MNKSTRLTVTERNGQKWIAEKTELGNGDRAWWFQLMSPGLKSDARPGTVGFYAITFEAGLMLLSGPEVEKPIDRRIDGYNPEFLGAKPAKAGEDY